ncbi:MAG: spermidine synthase [Candidatus Gastranaerophilaceae bacterium]
MLDKFSENGVIIPENIMKKEADIESVAEVCARMTQDEILWEKESDFHSISVCQNPNGRFMRYGISFQAGKIQSDLYSGNIPYLNYFLIPYLLQPNAENILVIGFGTGMLVNQLETLYKNLKSIDAVDIEENIMYIATEFFNFHKSDKFSFYLQDALVYLRENQKKYDLIIVDVAGNEGIDERFFEQDFFINIKKSLSKNGIFAFNSCANTDFCEDENEFFGFTINTYKKYFKNFAVFDGKTSDKVYYKVFFDINKRVLDVTNAIFIASDKTLREDDFKLPNENNLSEIKKIHSDITSYINDLHNIYF